PHNLPIQATSFVGRHDELAALTELLHSSRLITVTGVGGSGKTRLALQAVAALVPEVDAAWFIQLGAITDPDLVDGALLDALGLAQRSGVTPRQATLNHLSRSRSLILLDNCEHLIDATADLAAAILARAPDVTVVATSRELLGVSGEVVFGLRSLTLPKGTRRSMLRHSRNTMRSDSSPKERRLFNPVSASAPRTPRRSRRSANDSTACPSPSSWPLRGCAPSALKRSPHCLTSGSGSSPEAVAPRFRASRP
ncbi:MAG TPA: hypothetical protein VNB06_02840, partial [Thermoanaerobaculia bacterium]|nr:hypothetical protein [Thermoanaerobaculia bacterium]